MSLHHRLPDRAVRAVPQTSFFQKCPPQTRIALVTPDEEVDETRACEDVRGPQETTGGGRQRIEKKVLQPSERDVMLAAVPGLRAFAISLSGDADRADDLVQGTLQRALANISSFEPGTNMLAWLFTILRNQFLSEYRKRRREVEDCGWQLHRKPDVGSWAERFLGVQGALCCAREVTPRSARGPVARRRVRLLLRGSGSNLWDAGRDDKKPR